MNKFKHVPLYLLITLFSFTQAAFAVHLDVELWGEGDAMFAGFCRTPGIVGCDLDGLAGSLQLPPGALPKEGATGKVIFMADFQDLPGGDFKTKNPGFQSVQNALLANELVSYRALGVLKYWDAALSAWGSPVAETQIRLFGGLEASSVTNSTQCAGQLVCFSGVDGSSVFAADGIHGSSELGVDITNNKGVLHTHLSFFLENKQGQLGAPKGAYLVEMQAFSNLHPVPSEPFLILFNAGLTPDEFTAALLVLVGNPANNSPIAADPNPVENITRPVPIKGDVDLDGDVDRIDVALILLAVQKNAPLTLNNAMLDVDGDGVISRNDAFEAKDLCTLRLCNIPIVVDAAPTNETAAYDANSRILKIRDVQVQEQHYQVQLQLQDNYGFVLQSAQTQETLAVNPAEYDPQNQKLEIPVVEVNSKYYKARLLNKGAFIFQLEQFEELSGALE